MSTTIIPTRSDLPDYVITADLGGTDFGLHLSWNTRDSRWYLEILTAAGATLVAGIGVVVDYPVNLRFSIAGMPEGYLIFLDTTDSSTEIEKMEDLGDRVQLTFTPTADVS